MIAIHWFTYSGDSGILQYSIKAARKTFPEARLIVIDDERNPVPESVKIECCQLGAEWRSSSWDRGENLRGQEAITGILEEMIKSNADICLKLDPDTIVAKRSWLDRFESSDYGLTAADARGGMYGCAYAIKQDFLIPLHESVINRPFPFLAPEDMSLAERFFELFGRDKFLQIKMKTSFPDEYGNSGNGDFIVYHFSCTQYDDYASKYSIINCGNSFCIGASRRRQLDAMAGILHEIKSH